MFFRESSICFHRESQRLTLPDRSSKNFLPQMFVTILKKNISMFGYLGNLGNWLTINCIQEDIKMYDLWITWHLILFASFVYCLLSPNCSDSYQRLSHFIQKMRKIRVILLKVLYLYSDLRQLACEDIILWSYQIMLLDCLTFWF